MIVFPVNQGRLGCNYSSTEGLFIIKASDEEEEVRVVLDKKQLMDFIDRLNHLLETSHLA